jgi:hypothetical protein
MDRGLNKKISHKGTKSTYGWPTPYVLFVPFVANLFLEVATGFEVRAVGAHELAFLLVQLCPAVWAGSFDLFDLRCIKGAGRHAVYRLVVLCRSIPPDVRGL